MQEEQLATYKCIPAKFLLNGKYNLKELCEKSNNPKSVWLNNFKPEGFIFLKSEVLKSELFTEMMEKS